MSVKDEFATVDLVLNSGAVTRAVDAFALALIKSERQARKLLTYLVYQYGWCTPALIQDLRNALAARRGVYFTGIIAGWDALYPRSFVDLVGPPHSLLWPRMKEASRYRDKIFHGQVTATGLSTTDLEALVAEIREWREILAANATAEVGYDGFGWDSFRKGPDPQLSQRYKQQLTDFAAYQGFIETHMKRGAAQP